MAAAGRALSRHSLSAIAEATAHPLSSEELQNLLGSHGGVATYDAVFGREDFRGEPVDLRTALLEQPGRACAFLWRSEPTFGHWIAAFIGPRGEPYVFDSYGERAPDAWRRGAGAAALGQSASRPLILEGMLRAGYPRIHWNEYPLQRLDPAVQTCGRWAAVRIGLRALDVDEFAQAVHVACSVLGVDPDTLVTAATIA